VFARDEMTTETSHLLDLRTSLYGQLRERIEGLHLNGHAEKRLPGNLNVSFDAVDGEGLLMGLREIALSSGSACTSASLEPSYVLRAMGLTKDLAQGSIRFGLGRFNTQDEVDYVAGRVTEEVERLRHISSGRPVA